MSENISKDFEIKKDDRALDNKGFSYFVSTFGVYFIIVILLIAGTFVNVKFLSAGNLMNIVQAGAFLGMLCAGVAFITYSGHYVDLAAPITIALSGIVAISAMKLGFIPGILIGLATGTLVGVINAIVVGKFRANPIIWTLALNFVVSGIIRWVYSNRQIYPDVETGGSAAGDLFTQISRTSILGIPLGVYVMLAMFIVAQFVLSKTQYGKQLKIIGSNIETAKMSGINVTKILGIAYIISAFAASVAGIFVTSFGKVGAYYNGEGYDFRAVTAIVIGGMTLAGGRGNMVGVLGGVLTMGLLSNILTLLGVGTFQQQIITGLVFIAIVYINANSLRKLGKDNV